MELDKLSPSRLEQIVKMGQDMTCQRVSIVNESW